MARPLARIGYELFLVLRRGDPEDFGHRPRAVSVKNEQPVTSVAQLAIGALQGFGGGALQKGAGFFVYRAAQEIVRRGVTNVELDRLVELRELDQLGFAEIALLFGHFLRDDRDEEQDRQE